MLKADQVSKTIDGRTILTDISIELKKGSKVALIGPSGSGKSTLLRCLTMLERPTAGKIYLDQKVFDFNEVSNQRTDNIYPKITAIFQEIGLWPHMTVQKNMLLGSTNSRQAQDQMIRLTSKLGISHILNKYPMQCSGGEQQRANLVRQLILKPDYLLLDEVTSSLDASTTKKVIEVLKSNEMSGIGMLVITHSLNLAIDLTDDYYYMLDGRIVDHGLSRNLKDSTNKDLIDFIRYYN